MNVYVFLGLLILAVAFCAFVLFVSGLVVKRFAKRAAAPATPPVLLGSPSGSTSQVLSRQVFEKDVRRMRQ